MKNFAIPGIIILLLIQGAIWSFNGFFLHPDKVISVRFREVPPVIKIAGDIGVYYRGFKVGKAVCKRLSPDQQYIIFCIEIDYKDLKLPVNTKVILKTQDIFGDRYFDLIYPENPSQQLLVHGDMIEGTAVYERVDKYLVEELEHGKLGTLVENLNYLTGGARQILSGENKQLGAVSKEMSGSVNDISYIIREIKSILSDPEVKKDIKTILTYTPKTLKNVNEILAQQELRTTIKSAPALLNKTVTSLESVSNSLPRVGKSVEDVNNSIEEVNTYIPGVNNSLYMTNSLLGTTNSELECLNPKIPVVPQELVDQAGFTLKRYDCIGEALSKTLSKNCLFFRFLFGRPGEPFKQCACE